jgi:hypothetical protein
LYIAHPGLYYGVLRSTRVVPVFFSFQNDGDAVSSDES